MIEGHLIPLMICMVLHLLSDKELPKIKTHNPEVERDDYETEHFALQQTKEGELAKQLRGKHVGLRWGI